MDYPVKQEMDSIQPAVTHVECVNAEIRSGQSASGGMHRRESFILQVCWECWVSAERSAAAAWPRSHSSQAGGIDRPVIKSGALVGCVRPIVPPARPAAAVYFLPYALFNGTGAPGERGPIQGSSCPCFVLLIFN